MRLVLRLTREDLHQRALLGREMDTLSLLDLKAPAREAVKLVDVVEFVDGQFTVTLKDRTGIVAGTVRKEG